MFFSSDRRYNSYDPNLGDVGPGRPRYWWADFARAEHTRQYNISSRGPAVLCPFNCSAGLAVRKPPSFFAETPFCTKKRSFCQDRLGTNIGKALRKSDDDTLLSCFLQEASYAGAVQPAVFGDYAAQDLWPTFLGALAKQNRT
jgi:hypothetical protein